MNKFISLDNLNCFYKKLNVDSLSNKVDKEEGKQLSEENFTAVHKTKLEGLKNFDPTSINNAISTLQEQLATLTGDNASTAIDSFNEIIAFLEGIDNSENLDAIIASIETQLSNKADKEEHMSISDILKTVYPVGSIYLSVNPVDPYTLFNFGTWEQIEDRFLLAAGSTYSAGTTGGEAKHTLTVKELPKQGGKISTHGVYSGTPIAAVSGVFSASHSCSGKYMTGTASGHDSVDTITYSNGGEGTAHNNMPPYLTVYMWKRIS